MKNIWFKIIFAIIIGLMILGYIFPIYLFPNQEEVRTLLQEYGILGPLILIGLQIIQIIITPISAGVIGIASGYVYGLWLGALYNWIGRIIGCSIVFFIGRKLGRNILDKFVKKETMKKYDKLVEKHSILLLLFYFLPIFPDDEITYIAGASSLKFKKYFPLMAIGHMGGSIGFAYIGNNGSLSDPLIWIVGSLVYVIAFIMIFLLKKKERGVKWVSPLVPALVL